MRSAGPSHVDRQRSAVGWAHRATDTSGPVIERSWAYDTAREIEAACMVAEDNGCKITDVLAGALLRVRELLIADARASVAAEEKAIKLAESRKFNRILESLKVPE